MPTPDDTLLCAALCDMSRAAHIGITEVQQAYSLGRTRRRLRLTAFYAARARDRLAEARRIRERTP